MLRSPMGSPELSVGSVAFQAARALVFEGVAQPNGYTGPLLHSFRTKVKKRASA